MQSNKSLAVWASQTYSQTGGVNNWSQYQLSLTGTSAKLNVYSTNTTSTVFSFYANTQGNLVSTGDTLLLSTNGTSFTSGTAGVVTTTAPVDAAPATMSGAVSAGFSVSQGPTSYISPDGIYLYTQSYTASSTATLYQYTLATAFDLSTATLTRSRSITTGPYGGGVTFKPDGSTMYQMAGSVFKSYALGTAWDISTLATTPNGSITLTCPNPGILWNTAVGLNGVRISPDGTTVVAQNCVANSTNGSGAPYDNFCIFTMSVPWVVGSCTTTTTNYTNTNLKKSSDSFNWGFQITPDGSGIVYGGSFYGSTSCSYSEGGFGYLAMPNKFSLTTSVNYGFNLAWRPINNQSAMTCVWYLNATGTNIVAGTNFGTTRAISVVNYYTKYNVAINSFGLGSAPTAGYFPAPTVKVDAETTAARVNLFDYQVYMASSSTTQAVVYKPAAGYIATGDTLSLNGTTTVTTSAVSEGSTGGVAAVPIYTAANRSYASKNYTFPSDTSGTSCVRFSSDGSQVFALLTYGMPYGVGIYQFNMSTPWDISTASFGNMVLPLTVQSGTYNVAFDFSADGLRLIMWNCYVNGSGAPTTAANGYIHDYTLAQPFNIGTSTYVGSYSTNLSNTTYSPTSLRFTPNGQQVLAVYTDGTNYYIKYLALGTAYRIQTAGSFTNYFTTSANQIYDALLTPDGLNIVTLGGITTSNTLGTANSMATATTTNNPANATNKWTWPTGTVTSTYNCVIGNFSSDGTKFYVHTGSTSTAVCWQCNVMVIPQTSYTCTFPTQGSAPTSVVVPDRGVAQTITTTLSGGNMTFAASAVGTNARGIGMKITSPRQYTTITNATLNLWHS